MNSENKKTNIEYFIDGKCKALAEAFKIATKNDDIISKNDVICIIARLYLKYHDEYEEILKENR